MMDFLKQLETWAKGDALQGKIMFGIGLILLIDVIFMLQTDSIFFNGMLIPVSLLTVINIVYGGFLAFSRPKHWLTATENYKQNPAETLKKEWTKAKTDNRNYTMGKMVWLILAPICFTSFFFLTDDYYKGLAIGLAILFIGIFLLDIFLHRRLKPYFNILQQLIK